jgi:pimeloyl-ACP methyl ester carboxylesterase
MFIGGREMKMKKKIVVIVPGAKFIKSRNKFVQSVIVFLYRLTNTNNPVYNNYADGWKPFFASRNENVIWLHWSRGFTNISKNFAVRKLNRLLKNYKTYEVTLVGMSLGGEIVLESARNFKGCVKKIILVASTNEKERFNEGKAKVINIYSSEDDFQKLAIKVLSPIYGSVHLKGKNVTNVNLPGIAHDRFFANVKVGSGKFKDKTISEVIELFIKK